SAPPTLRRPVMASGNGVLTSLTLLSQLRDLGNDAAWRTFLERYAPSISSWGRRSGLPPADAEEAQSRMLAKLVEHLPTLVYDAQGSSRRWLRAVVVREARNFQRRRLRHGGDRAAGGSDVQLLLKEVPAPDHGEELVDLLEEVCRVVTRVRRRVE